MLGGNLLLPQSCIADRRRQAHPRAHLLRRATRADEDLKVVIVVGSHLIVRRPVFCKQEGPSELGGEVEVRAIPSDFGARLQRVLHLVEARVGEFGDVDKRVGSPLRSCPCVVVEPAIDRGARLVRSEAVGDVVARVSPHRPRPPSSPFAACPQTIPGQGSTRAVPSPLSSLPLRPPRVRPAGRRGGQPTCGDLQNNPRT
eukprot:scaffold316292_cov31-Tisochrysis_lutea.AAC.1